MHHTFHTSPVNQMTYIPFEYSPQVNIPSPPECYALDLSKKRPQSPDYTYCYPSPKSSPKSSPSHGECESSKCCTQSPRLSQSSDQKIRVGYSSYSSSPEGSTREIKIEPVEVISYTQSCPRSPKSPSCYSESNSETSFQSDATGSPTRKCRAPRPFKALPKDSLTLAFNAIAQVNPSSLILDDKDLDPETTKHLIEESVKKYAEFREKMLQQLHNNNTSTNKNMRRLQNNLTRIQDPEYLEKRRKNNNAAKRSRDARRNKQDEIAIRVTFLEQENIMLKYKIQSEKEDLVRLQSLTTTGK